MKVLITGATGTAGSELVRQAISDPSITQILLLIRRASEFSDPKIKEIIHNDFTNYDGLRNIFKETDACFWCLGISQSRVSKSQYYTITHDYVVAAAKAMLEANPEMTLLFLSGQGADSKEKSPVRFAKVKGKAENALIKLHPRKLFIVRPGGIIPTSRSGRESIYKRSESFMIKLMGAVFPWSVISTNDLALAMLKVAKEGYGKMILSHRNLKNL
ncbi:MAG: NAD(P)H-binding protein [Chitinophagaceae bacterium]|nr:NAD(P)H-binding protein [Chitinophagaceae bacterium]